MSSPKHSKREEKRLETLKKTTDKKKAEVLAELAKYPVVTSACKQADVGRATYYKWLEEDKKFVLAVEKATIDGKRFVTDMAKAQLLKLVSAGDKTAIIFLLKNYDPDFTDKVRYLHEHKHKHVLTLTKEKRKELEKAFSNVGLATLLKREAGKANQPEEEEIDIE